MFSLVGFVPAKCRKRLRGCPRLNLGLWRAEFTDCCSTLRQRVAFISIEARDPVEHSRMGFNQRDKFAARVPHTQNVDLCCSDPARERNPQHIRLAACKLERQCVDLRKPRGVMHGRNGQAMPARVLGRMRLAGGRARLRAGAAIHSIGTALARTGHPDAPSCPMGGAKTFRFPSSSASSARRSLAPKFS